MSAPDGLPARESHGPMNHFFHSLVVAAAIAAAAGPAAARTDPSPSTGGPLADVPRACQTLVHARGLLAGAAALAGDAPSFQAVSDSAAGLHRTLSESPEHIRSGAAAVLARIQRSAEFLRSRQSAVLQSHEALRLIRKNADALLEDAEAVMSAELVAGSGAARVAAASQLAMLTQRIAKTAAEFIRPEGIDADAAFLMGKDPKSFTLLATGLRDGHAELRLRPGEPAAKAKAARLLVRFETTREASERVLSNLRDLVGAHEAQKTLRLDAETLERALQPMCFSRI